MQADAKARESHVQIKRQGPTMTSTIQADTKKNRKTYDASLLNRNVHTVSPTCCRFLKRKTCCTGTQLFYLGVGTWAQINNGSRGYGIFFMEAIG